MQPPSSGGPLLQHVNGATYDITQRIVVTNQDVSSLGLLELNLPIPLAAPEQAVERVREVGDRTFRLRDVNGHGLVVRSLYRDSHAPPGPGETRSLEVSYRLVRKEIRTNAAALMARNYPPYNPKDRDFAVHTRSERTIETDAPEIAAVALELVRKWPNPYLRAKAAYEYVLDHVEYASPSPSRSARECMRQGKGDCGTYTLLFTALCRATGIPTRPIAGCWASGDNPWHCWAEFHLPGVGWIPVDPSVGDRGPKEREYYFGNLDNNRVTLARTFKFTVDTKDGSTDVEFVQVGTWWWFPAQGSSGSKMHVEHSFHGVRVGK